MGSLAHVVRYSARIDGIPPIKALAKRQAWMMQIFASLVLMPAEYVRRLPGTASPRASRPCHLSPFLV